MTIRVWRGSTTSERALTLTALAAACAWGALILAFGGLRFDDFVNIAESRGALSPEGWTGLAADGRWQPLKRATYDALARIAGLTFWPYAVVVMAAHVAMAAGVASSARAIWRTPGAAPVAGAVALSSLNLSGYSVSYVATLHGIASVALTAWCVSLALHAAVEPRRRAARLTLAALTATAACLYKETAVMTPAVVLFAVWLAARGRPVAWPQIARAVGAPVAGVLTYFVLRLIADVPLIPAGGRYGGRNWPGLVNALVILSHVMPWAGAALIGAAWRGRAAARGQGMDVAVMAIATLGAIFPTLFLSWQSPNFFYAAIPVAALGTAGLTHGAESRGRSHVALAALIVVALAGSAGSAAWRGVHLWGPYSEGSLSQWLTYPREGGRVVWFDADSHARYGGLVRTIGPGDRLTYALRLASGDPRIEGEACISVPVSAPYVPRPGDELYLHTAGRLEPLASPPSGNWYCDLP